MSYPFGHQANEWEDIQLCPYCGMYHPPGACPGESDPDDGPPPEPTPDPDEDWDLPEEPPEVSGSAEYPRWCYGLPPALD